MPRNRTGNLGLEIPGADPVLNLRLRRIAEEIEKMNGSRDTGVETVPSGTAALGFSLPQVNAALKIVDGVLGVRTGGITTDLIRIFAISASRLAAGAVETDKIKAGAVITTKIANAAITNALIANAAVGTLNVQDAAISTAKIQNLAITNALIANLAVTDAKIGSLAANKITAGTLNAVNMVAGTLTLALNGITTTITNAYDAQLQQYVGVRVADTLNTTAGRLNANNISFIQPLFPTGTGTAAFLGATQMFVADIRSNGKRFVQCVSRGAVATIPAASYVEVSGADVGGSIQYKAKLDVNAAGPSLLFNDLQVLGPRSAAVADATDAPSAIAQLNVLLARLRAHGVIAT